MRIAIVTWNRRRIAGTETYLSKIIPSLQALGHSLALWHEQDQPLDRECIELPAGSPRWCVTDLGIEAALDQLRRWQPDLIYAHGLTDPDLEATVVQIAPSVFFAHNYHGNCVSGAKMFKRPRPAPCSRRFGWQCLLHFYPRGCGGLNPLTTWSQYQLQSKRHDVLYRYRAIVVFTEHLQKEYARHGLRAHLAYGDLPQIHDIEIADSKSEAGASSGSCWRLVFLGRMDFLKGGHVFLDALTRLPETIEKPVHVLFAGDGPDRALWLRKANEITQRCPRVTIEFKQWLTEPEVAELLNGSDLVVLPSLWPEPFGLAVVEAGRQGVPVAAFAVGGIPFWLRDGVNGYLAQEITADALADAIHKCLRDPAKHSQLRRGAIAVAKQFEIENHTRVLDKIFQSVIRNGKPDGENVVAYPGRP